LGPSLLLGDELKNTDTVDSNPCFVLTDVKRQKEPA